MLLQGLDNIIKIIPDNRRTWILLILLVIPQDINIDYFLKNLIKENKIPVVAPLGLDENDNVFNINGDTAASAICKKT